MRNSQALTNSAASLLPHINQAVVRFLKEKNNNEPYKDHWSFRLSVLLSTVRSDATQRHHAGTRCRYGAVVLTETPTKAPPKLQQSDVSTILMNYKSTVRLFPLPFRSSSAVYSEINILLHIYPSAELLKRAGERSNPLCVVHLYSGICEAQEPH